MAYIAGAPLFLGLPGMDRERIHPGEGVSGGRRRDLSRETEALIRRRFQGDVFVIQIATESKGKFPVDGLMALTADL
jgi:hypothetical protein